MKAAGTSSGGEIVQVEGRGRTNKKDRHSKVYTSKGPRDRRVRLAAHTAIQFYDVQDRLGYDRPSKAVDWLIDKAQTAIHNLNVSSSSSHDPAANYSTSSFVDPQSADHHHHDQYLLKPFFPLQGGEDLGLEAAAGFGWNNGMPFESSLNPNLNPYTEDDQFEAGFRVPTRIYGDEQHPINHL